MSAATQIAAQQIVGQKMADQAHLDRSGRLVRCGFGRTFHSRILVITPFVET